MMRVLHVVTLISPDGAFGGPVRVALNLASATADRGHQVVVAAATRGWERPPEQLDGVSVRLFPSRQLPGIGLAGVYSIGLARWLVQNIRDFDLVHIHFARDLVTVPAASLAAVLRVPFVLQTHGMVDPSTRLTARLLDVVAVRHLLRRAGRVLDLTDKERSDLVDVARHGRIRSARLINGTFIRPPSPSSTTHPFPSVLFLSRLHTRKRPRVFVEMAKLVHERRSDAKFALVGPDEGEAAAVTELIDRIGAQDYVQYEGALPPDSTLVRMQMADVFVLPSVDEVFPMAALEALSAGVPVVIGGSAAMAARIRATGAGAVPATDDPADFAAAVLALIRSREAQSTAAQQARMLAEEYSMTSVARDAVAYYESVIAQSRGARRSPQSRRSQ